MDFEELKRKAEARRRRPLEVAAGVTLHLRQATRHEVTLELARRGRRPGGEPGPETPISDMRVFVEMGVVGWQGVCESHVTGDLADTAPLVWSAAAVPLLLDAQSHWELMAREALLDLLGPATEKN